MTFGNRSPVMSNIALAPPFSLMIYDLRSTVCFCGCKNVLGSWLVGIGTEEYRTGIARRYRTGNGRGDRPTDKRCFDCLHVYNVYRTLVHKSIYRFHLTLDLLMDRNVGAFSRNFAIDRLRRIEIWMDRWARESFSAWPVPPNQQQ
jgi:hypothetical protein